MKIAENLALGWQKIHELLFQIKHRGRFVIMSLEKVPILPIEEHLKRWRGGSVWRGGPQIRKHHPKCPGIMHYRGNELEEDQPKNSYNEKSWKTETTLLFWCGPIVNHYGHQLGEFGGRVLLASLDERGGSLLFLHPEKDMEFDKLESWQKDWIDYLNPRKKEIQIRKGEFVAKELIIIPQQQRLGEYPTEKILKALTENQKRIREKEVNTIIIVSRSNYAPCIDKQTMRGSIAGEKEFNELMKSKGGRIMHPEKIGLKEQLEQLHNAQYLIVTEGSAMHTLELLGRNASKKIMIIARRPYWKGMDRPLRSRFPNLIWVDAVDRVIWIRTANPRVKGLAIVNWHKIIDRINKYFCLNIEKEEANRIENWSRIQVERLQKLGEYEIKKVTKQDRRYKKAGGW